MTFCQSADKTSAAIVIHSVRDNLSPILACRLKLRYFFTYILSVILCASRNTAC